MGTGIRLFRGGHDGIAFHLGLTAGTGTASRGVEMRGMTDSKKCLLIVNPVAGRKSIIKHLTQVVRIFMDAGYLVTVMVTGSCGEAETLTQAHASSHDLVVAAGGDGTLHEVVSGMRRSGASVPVGYIPCGSTNEFAIAQNIPTDILKAAHAISRGGYRAVDLGTFGDQIFCGSTVFGAFSWIGYTTDQDLKNKLGMGAYVLDGAFDLGLLKPWHMKITVNGITREDDYIFGCFSNAESLAGILHYPEGLVSMSDGLWELMLIRMPQNIAQWQQVLHAIRAQELSSCQMIEIEQTDRVLVENPDGLCWSLDGERSGEFRTVCISVLPGALQLRG